LKDSRVAAPTRFAILIYEGVEPIDLGATYGVLSMARRIDEGIEILLVAAAKGPVRLANDLVVEAHHGFADCPAADVMIVTGGPGWTAQVDESAILDFIGARAETMTVASVCTGAMILGAAGLLDGLPATTKKEVVGDERPPLDLLLETYPTIEPVSARYVDAGSIVTGGGVTLAIDTTLHLIGRFRGERVARETARIIEYSAAEQANERTRPARNL
jgi:transcriptional regulator GlxA family with amidase domain